MNFEEKKLKFIKSGFSIYDYHHHHLSVHKSTITTSNKISETVDGQGQQGSLGL